jgi:RNA polymerase sigma-70 factor, ECF subfamily
MCLLLFLPCFLCHHFRTFVPVKKHTEPVPPLEHPIQIKTRADFEAMFKAQYSPLCSYANSILKDLDASEEVVQEVMFKIWNIREKLVIDSSMKSYLFRAVRNGCMNVLKHQKIREAYRVSRESDHIENQRSQEDEMIMTELECRIREAIDRLPLERRKVFILSRYDGLTYNQIADKLNISVKTVENQMGKALRSLREELKDYLPWVLFFFSEVFRD